MSDTPSSGSSGSPVGPAQQASRLLRRLSKGLDDRAALPGGAAREKLDEHLVETLIELEGLVAPPPSEQGGAPPRPVAIAIAMALYSHPHLQILFGDPVVGATEPVPDLPLPRADFPVLFPNEAVIGALGLNEWELDDLREEIDRRVGRVMKQARALEWMWAHFNLPREPGPDAAAATDALMRVLFPGASGSFGTVGLVRRGPQLYALVDHAPPPLSSLFLSWSEIDEERTFPPIGTFQGRYVDRGLRRALGRGIGASDDEVVEILDRMVTVLPRESVGRYLTHDHWRARALAGITDLGSPYTQAAWLIAEVAPEDVPAHEWMRVVGGKVTVGDAIAAFDGLALGRVTVMLRQLHAEFLARITNEGPGDPSSPRFSIDDLDLYDLRRHIKAVLAPLLDWASSDRTVQHLTEKLGANETDVRTALDGLAAAWTTHLDAAWIGGPQKGRPRSVQSILVPHLVQTHGALRSIWSRRADHRFDHRDMLALFTAHYYAECPAHRVWADGLTDTGAPKEDAVGRWFWSTWNRLLDTVDTDASTFSGPFQLDV